MAELLLEKGYELHGPIRRDSTFNTSRIDHRAGPDDTVALLVVALTPLDRQLPLVTLMERIAPTAR